MTITNTVESAFATVRSAASDLHDMGSVAVADVSGRCTEIAEELESAVGGIDMERGRDALRATVEEMQRGSTRQIEGYAAEVAGTLKALADATT